MAKIWKATYNYDENGQHCAAGVHYQFDGVTGSDEPSASSVADKIDAKLTNAFKAMVRDDGIVRSLVVLEEVDPAGSAVPEHFEKTLNVAGGAFSGTAGSMAAEEVALIHRKTGAAVRGAQSWLFSPSPRGGASITGGNWDTGSAFWGFWTAFAALLDDDLNYAGPVPGVMGDLHPVAYARTRRRRGLTPYTFRVTSPSVDPRPRWLRSRGN